MHHVTGCRERWSGSWSGRTPCGRGVTAATRGRLVAIGPPDLRHLETSPPHALGRVLAVARRSVLVPIAAVASMVAVTALSGAIRATAGPPPATTAAVRAGGPLPVPPPPATPAGVTVAPPDVPSAGVSPDGEIASQRTASSRTFQTGTASRRTQVFDSPVNYRDANGVWQKIDTTLTGRGDGSLAPAGSGEPVVLPASLTAGPVTVTSGGATVGFTLAGAGSSGPTATGSTATYPNVLAGVTARETATPTGVREELLLASAAATRTFTTAVSLPAGDRLQAGATGGATVLDPAGGLVGTISPPTVRDAAGVASASAVTLTVAGDTVTETVDPSWLSASGRAFPVDVDPDYTGNAGANQGQLESGSQANVNYGNPSTNCVGNDPGHANAVARSAFSFPDLGASLSRDAVIQGVALNLYVSSVGAATQLQSYNLTQPFTWWQTTWNNATTSTAWTAPGGTYATGGGTPVTVAATGWTKLNLNANWVQGWLDNPNAPQDGVLLKAGNEAGTNQICFAASGFANGPSLNVFWQQRAGVGGSEQYFNHAIDSHESVKVNLADGNLVDTSTEYADKAPGVPLNISRTYNSLYATQPWMNGLGWWNTPADNGSYAQGSGTGPYPLYDGSIEYADPTSGADNFLPWHPADYTNPSAGHFVTPAGANSVFDGTTPTATVTDNKSQTVVTITPASNDQVANIASRAGLTETIAHNTTTFAPVGDDEVTAVTDTGGRTFTYADGAGGGYITGITGPVVNGAALTTAYTYQGGPSYNSALPNGELITAKDTGGGMTSYGYDSSYRITKITSPQGNIVTLTYDATNRVTSITYVTNTMTLAGDTYLFTYTAPTATDPQTVSTWGSTVVKDPLWTAGTGHTTTYLWNADDQIMQVTDGMGRHRAATFDPNGDGLSATDGLSSGLGTGGGNVSSMTYDNVAHNGATTWNPMTSQGAKLSATMTAATASLGYPTVGGGGPVAASYEPTSSTDGQSHVTTMGYDTMGLQNATALPTNPATGTSWGSVTATYQGEAGISCGAKTGEVCSSTNPDGASTTYGYDSAGNVTSVHPPAPLPASTVTPDTLGRPVTTVDGNANTTRYVYNNSGEVTATELAGSTTCTTANISAGTCDAATYDADGRQLTLADATGTTTYSYDATGAEYSSNEPGYYSNTVTYDAAGNVTAFTDDGGTVNYYYDAANTLIDVQEPGGTCQLSAGPPPTYYTASSSIPASARCIAFGYDGNAGLVTLRYPGNSTVNYTRDNDGRILTLAALQPDGGTDVMFSQTLAYQSTGAPGTDTQLVQSLTDTDTGAHVYGYDTLNRLVSDKIGSAAPSTWTYDAAGNRLTYTPPGGSTVYSAYNPADQLCETGTTTIPAGKYTGANAACTSGSPAGTNTLYTYDGDGNQTTGLLPAGATTLAYNTASQTTSTTTGGVTTPNTYNGTSQTIRQTGGGNAYFSGLIAQNGQPTRVTNGPTYDWITRAPDGTPLSLRSGSGGTSTNWYYTRDYQGSGRRLTAAGDYGPDGLYSYDTYGQTLTRTNYYTQLTLNPVNYTGGTNDTTTGLTKQGTRYYNPQNGRFTQADGSGQDPCTYAYAADNPTSLADASGAAPCEILRQGSSTSPEGTLAIIIKISASHFDSLGLGVLAIYGHKDGRAKVETIHVHDFLIFPGKHEFEFETDLTDIEGYSGVVGLVGARPCLAAVGLVGVIRGAKY